MTINHQTYFTGIINACSEIESTADPDEYCKLAIRYLEEEKVIINDWLRTFNFISDDDEIYFFKILKPQLTAKIIYLKKRFEIELQLPTSQKARYKYYDHLLVKNTQRLNGLKTIGRYIRNNCSHRDYEYFLRKNNNSDLNDQYQFVFLDEKTTTKMEFSLARLLAKEQFIGYLESKMDEIEKKCISSNIASNLKWTGTNLDFIELIYGLQLQKVINGGNTEVKEIAKVFCGVFNLKIEDQIYRYFIDIKRRKNNKTRFLQATTDTLNNALESE